MTPPPPWLDAIFRPVLSERSESKGLGLACPTVMVHGNHEGFAHLATLFSPRRAPTNLVPIEDLPTVDTLQRIHYLPSGWRTTLPSGHTLAGVGGMEAGQRRAKYHPLAYIDPNTVSRLASSPPVDILLTHQGPAALQNDHGSPTLDTLLDPPIARFWFHGHSTPILIPTPLHGTLIVPLGDIACIRARDPGLDGWALLDLHPDGSHTLHRDPPHFWRDLRLKNWHITPAGRLVHPDLASHAAPRGAKFT
jgi:hypothetical protein